MKPVEKILERAENTRQVNGGWLVSCPLPEHGQGRGDTNPSVSIAEGDDGRALVKCNAGCGMEAIVAAWSLSMSDLFERRNGNPGERRKEFGYTPRRNTATLQRCTLEDYAEAKRLPIEFLKKLGLRNAKYQGSQAVRIPYYLPDGSEVAVRFRLALEKTGEGDLRFKWRGGSKTNLYGLERLGESRKPDTSSSSRARATLKPSGITASRLSVSPAWILGRRSGRSISKAPGKSTPS